MAERAKHEADMAAKRKAYWAAQERPAKKKRKSDAELIREADRVHKLARADHYTGD